MSGERPAAFSLSAFSGPFWACEPGAARAYRATVDAIVSGRVQVPTAARSYAATLEAISGGSVPAVLAADLLRQRGKRTAAESRVGVIPVRGFLTDHSSWVSDALSWDTYDSIGGTADLFAADGSITAVVIDCDSGGGSVLGTQECAQRIAALAQVKPVIGYVNAFCCSAAFWLLSQTNRLLAMPSAQMGSVGVLLVHESFAGFNEQLGVEITYLTSSAAPKKAEGNPDSPLDSDARTYMLKQLNEYHSAFVAAVAKGRRTTPAVVERDYGQGRAMGSADALRVGAVCGTAATLLEVISRAAAGEGAPKRASVSAQAVRNREILARLEAEVAADTVPRTLSVQEARERIARFK